IDPFMVRSGTKLIAAMSISRGHPRSISSSWLIVQTFPRQSVGLRELIPVIFCR
ncbi:hypothetical protein L9F63_000059, partial [Diploptera punctata]